MLKKPCPYHKGPVNHTLEQCEMLKKYYNRVAHRDEDRRLRDGVGGKIVQLHLVVVVERVTPGL